MIYAIPGHGRELVSEPWSISDREFEMDGTEYQLLSKLLEGTSYSARIVAQDGGPGWAGWQYWVAVDVPDDDPIAPRVRLELGLPPRP
jgi:hypothetical protein